VVLPSSSDEDAGSLWSARCGRSRTSASRMGMVWEKSILFRVVTSHYEEYIRQRVYLVKVAKKFWESRIFTANICRVNFWWGWSMLA